MSTDTQAIVIPSKNGGYVIENVTLEAPQDDEVLVKMVACGLCHTDLNLENGAFPSPFPNIPGHEGGGIVQAVGSKVTRVKTGDKVLLSYTSCASCASCSSGRPGACPEWEFKNFMRKRGPAVGDAAGLTKTGGGEKVWGGFFGQSSMGRMAIASEASCVVVPDDTDLKLFAPLGCGLQTGSGAILNRLKPEPDSSIAIYGCGAVGMSAILAASYSGVKTIIAVDLVDSRLSLAKEFGATHVVNGKAPDAIQQIKDLTDHKMGTTYAVEATGNARVLRNAYDALAPFGHLTSCGTPGPGNPVPFEIHEHVIGAKIYSAVLMGCGNPQTFLPFLIDLHKQGKFPIEKMTKFYSMEEFDEAVHDMHTGKIIKPVIIF